MAIEYYFKMPGDLHERDVVVVDPMLATGHSAVAAVDRLRELRPNSIKFVCLLTCPEGIAAMADAHPDVPIYTAAIDRQLNEHGYILPGPRRRGRPHLRHQVISAGHPKSLNPVHPRRTVSYGHHRS